MAKQSAEARFLSWERPPHKHADLPLEGKKKDTIELNPFFLLPQIQTDVYHDLIMIKVFIYQSRKENQMVLPFCGLLTQPQRAIDTDTQSW